MWQFVSKLRIAAEVNYDASFVSLHVRKKYAEVRLVSGMPLDMPVKTA